MKKRGVIGIFVISLLVVSLMISSFAFVNASWFSDIWGKITGKAVITDSLDNGLVSYFNFDGNARDSVSGKNATVSGPLLKTGIKGQAYSFDGRGDVIRAPNVKDNVNFRLGNFTVAAWINGSGYIFDLREDGDDSETLVCSSGGCSFYTDIDGKDNSIIIIDTSVGVYNPNQWTHIVLTKLNNDWKIYINGNLNKSRINAPIIRQPATHFDIGFSADAGGASWNGLLDEIGVWKRALSASEVKQLYDSYSVSPPNQTTQANCTDSDGGLNYYVKGKTSGKLYWSEEDILDFADYYDFCWSSSNGNSSVGTHAADFYCDLNGYVRQAAMGLCPNGCLNGACVNKSQNQTQNLTCTDSDGGLNYYVKGSVATRIMEYQDYCSSSGGNTLIERTCGSNNLVFDVVYNCSKGCVDGACKVNYTYPSPFVVGNWVDAEIIFGNNSPTIDLVVATDLAADIINKCSPSCNGNVLVTKDYEVSRARNKSLIVIGNPCDNEVTKTILGLRNLSSDLKQCYQYVGDKLGLTQGHYLIKVVQSPYNPNKIALLVLGYAASDTVSASLKVKEGVSTLIGTEIIGPVASDDVVCASLIKKIKNPTGTEERRLGWNWTYFGDEWVNGKIEKYIQYGASWNWNAQEYKEGQINYYHVNYNVQIFDNKDIDLSESASWTKQDPACKVNNYWTSKNKENVYFICNWNALSNNQDLDNNKQNHRQIFWYNGNVVVRIYLYYGTQLSDAEVIKLSQQKINDLINSLENNQYKYVDWNNFNIDWPAGREFYDTIQECGSEVKYNWSEEYLSWNCKTEPVVCPPHGYQNQICVAWSQKEQKEIKRENQIYCSPGICSGCYTPRWFGGNDNKCIPYGFRFAKESGFIEKMIEYEHNESLEETSNREVILKVLGKNSAVITLFGKYDNGTVMNVSYDLIKGRVIKLKDMPGWGRDASMTLEVLEIYYSTEKGKSYVNFKIKYSYLGKEIQTFNAYCDIDGGVKQQKSQPWEACQNNYECESNICSYGKCVDLKGIAEQANAFKGTFVKVVCRLSNTFKLENYNKCVYKYLGKGNSTTLSSSNGNSRRSSA